MQPGSTRAVRDRRVDADAAHLRQVDDQAVVAAAEAGAVVAAAADREQQLVLAGVVDRGHDVGGVGAARDHLGPLVDHAVVQRPGLVVVLVRRTDQPPAKSRNRNIAHDAGSSKSGTSGNRVDEFEPLRGSRLYASTPLLSAVFPVIDATLRRRSANAQRRRWPMRIGRRPPRQRRLPGNSSSGRGPLDPAGVRPSLSPGGDRQWAGKSGYRPHNCRTPRLARFPVIVRSRRAHMHTPHSSRSGAPGTPRQQ